MKNAASGCNIVLPGFTCLVTPTEGATNEAGLKEFMLPVVLTRVLSRVVIGRNGSGKKRRYGMPGLRNSLRT